MSLRCSNDGREFFAFDVENSVEWELLRKQNQTRQHLSMMCCGAPVVLRTSKLGVRHFSHARKGECATAPESPEHLLAKRQIVEGIQLTDWRPAVEQAGESGALGMWTADVLATKGSAKIAFEVQWSRQTLEETQQRQLRYKAGGVRALWLFRQHDFPVEKDVPAFHLRLDEALGRFQVLLPSSSYDPAWVRAKDKNEPRYWQQSIDLAKFVEGALSRCLKFAPSIGASMPLEVDAAYVPCWRCKKETGLVLGLRFSAGRVFAGHGDIEATIYDFDEFPEGAQVLSTLLPAALLKSHRIGAIKPRYSATVGGEYISNGCLHCDALQGRFFDHEYAYDAQKVMEVPSILSASWAEHLQDASSAIHRWWFDDSSVDCAGIRV